MRAFVERHNSPPVHNLITFGSQHMVPNIVFDVLCLVLTIVQGISDIPLCRPFDLLCQVARRAAKGSVYSSWAQENLIQVSLSPQVAISPSQALQAQYFRDPANLETYFSANHFLTSINNELPVSRNATYARNLASLNTLVLVLFTEDKTAVPKESAWFGSEVLDGANEEQSFFEPGQQRAFTVTERADRVIIPMRLQPLYKDDWIGLRELDERNGVVFDVCEGEHMQISTCWERIVRQYVGNI